MSDKKYIAMVAEWEFVRDELGNIVYEDRPSTWNPSIIHKVAKQQLSGKFKEFGANGKVVSLYDSPAKAARYCGKNGHVVEMDPADCRRVNCSLEEQFVHCEERMLFWGQEADRIKKLLLKDK